MRDGVVDAMNKVFGVVGNPSALHSGGREARRYVEESREHVAQAVGALPGEVVFTSGGSEADNEAIKGLYWSRHSSNPARTRVLISAVEHHAVSDSAIWLERTQGASVEQIPVDEFGTIRLDLLRDSIDRDPASVALVSVMWANNEVGTIQPIADVVALCRPHAIPVHSDAVQAFGSTPIDFAAVGLHAMTVSAHKYGGPIGVGALILQRQLKPTPVLHGGGQERDVRSGTIPMPLIVGMAQAFVEAAQELDEHVGELSALRDRLIAGVRAADPTAVLRGHPANRLPGNAHFTFPGCDGDALLMLLDAEGIQVSTGSACSAGVPRASDVLLAMGIEDATARGAIRFSLGRTTTAADVDAVVAALPGVLDRARVAGLVVR